MLLVRETPLHVGHLRLLVQLAEMGAVVMPPVPAFYHRPSSIQHIVDQTVSRGLDQLGIELEEELFPRWHGPGGAADVPVCAGRRQDEPSKLVTV